MEAEPEAAYYHGPTLGNLIVSLIMPVVTPIPNYFLANQAI